LNGYPTLSKDQSIGINDSIVYVTPKLLTTIQHDTMLSLVCNYGVYFLNTPKAKIVTKCGRPNQLRLMLGLLGGFKGCIKKVGNHGVEYRDIVDLT
jgi:hypothetical protein